MHELSCILPAPRQNAIDAAPQAQPAAAASWPSRPPRPRRHGARPELLGWMRQEGRGVLFWIAERVLAASLLHNRSGEG